jgi:hypothetical protein
MKDPGPERLKSPTAKADGIVGVMRRSTHAGAIGLRKGLAPVTGRSPHLVKPVP